MDQYVTQKIGLAKQSARRRFPRANFVKRFSSLKSVTAEEWDGVLFTMFLFLQTAAGSDCLVVGLLSRKLYSKPELAQPRVRAIVRTVSEMLCFLAWTRYGPYGFAGDEVGAGRCIDVAHKRVLLMLRNIKLYIPRESHDKKLDTSTEDGQGFNIQKFHDMKWVVPFIARFGSPWNFDAGAGESLLKLYAKQPGATVQKTSDRTMGQQLFCRLRDTEALLNYSRRGNVEFILDEFKQKKRGSPAPATSTACPCDDPDDISAFSDDDDVSSPVSSVPSTHRLRARLWDMDLVAQTGTGSITFEMFYPRSKLNELALPPCIQRMVYIHAETHMRKNGISRARATGFAELKQRYSPPSGSGPVEFFVRSHPSHSLGAAQAKMIPWYDWVLVNWTVDAEIEPSESIPGDIPLPRPEDNPFLTPGLSHEVPPPHMEYLLNHAWPATFLPSVYPAKVLAVFTVEYGATEAAPPAGGATLGAVPPERQKELLLIIHSCNTPASNDQNTEAALLLKRWKMEYQSEGEPSPGEPLFRIVRASAIIGSIFVMDPYHDEPFVKEAQRKDPYIYGVMERSDAWPRQFLYSSNHCS
jgi:hypothetical protein